MQVMWVQLGVRVWWAYKGANGIMIILEVCIMCL